MAALSQTHQCEWRERAEGLERENLTLKARVGSIESQLALLQRTVFGKKSEKLPRVEDELRKAPGAPPRPREATLKERRLKREARATLPERVIHHRVPDEARRCPSCGGTALKPLGPGKRTELIEYVPAHVERQVHPQETLACPCGAGIVTAPAPKAIEQGQYGPGFLAHVVTAKCCDSIPLYRQAKALARAGMPVARTTLCDLFHEVGRATAPLASRLLALVREASLVHADETPQRVLDEGKARRAYVWTFRTDELIAYVHSASRSGVTPMDVLGGTGGYLLVDGYTGYNRVTLPEGRVRVGCWAHVRRKFFDALPTAPESRAALDFILALYHVEHSARDTGTLGTQEHLDARRTTSARVLKQLATWVDEQFPRHPPKSPLGMALRHTKGQWSALTRFLDDPSLPLDNNAAERALRAMALGRKNYLFVGSDEAGRNLAGLSSLVATCEVNGVNPEAYLADVLMRLGSHPVSRLDELLPHRWQPSSASAPDSS
ncbi:IS66 family transposase [Myxococcus landrumensis]|uniref:IS66 family transposase n=1 Tax=Myxococcus landrumensis TaxID=2813577 RepID=A0ABX7NFA9_9BACT|nr:IS66 family transposase [Myxococcus landrumus]QSQ17465.1 IS66 family transposase [Myxococcus landrumus]